MKEESRNELNCGEDVSPELMSAADQELFSWFDGLFGRRPPYLDESLAPRVDMQVIELLVRRKLPERSARLALRLVVAFKSWNDAYTQAIVDDYHRTKRPATESGESGPSGDEAG